MTDYVLVIQQAEMLQNHNIWYIIMQVYLI